MKHWKMQRLLDDWKKLTSGSINRKIFGAAVIVGFLTAFVKVASVGKELVIAWRFGTGDEIDAFLIALVIPSFIINVVAASFNAALIPTYIKVREQEGKIAGQKLFSGATVWSLGLLIITTILVVSTAPLYLPLIALGFSSQKLDLTFRLLCALAPIVLLNGMIVIWGAVLNAGERFALAAICPIISPVITVILLVGFKSWGIFALAASLVFGAVVEMVILGVGLHRQGISLLPKWYGFDAHMRLVVNQYAPIVAGSLLICSAGSIDQVMAAMLSPGSVAALNYGNKVIASPISLITTALSTAVIPYFSKMLACQDWKGVNHTLKQYLQLIFLTTVPLTVLLFIFSEVIVQALFQRGSFTVENTQLVAQIQACYSLQLPFYVANILVVRLITSMQKNHILVWISALNTLVNITLNYFFIKWMGIKGIALSTSCIYLCSFLTVLIFALKTIKENQVLQKKSM
ncbi:virulence factor MviN [Scytonema hofmannii PCC 7110]|uniref:Virulence factor MviN n=2 Tax=Scytonema hofmannii TaxID=34078 RepID=A0A139X5Z1_9CYAN|nr:virulence factor MviN [Scytonema hofmannii PCC 7110]